MDSSICDKRKRVCGYCRYECPDHMLDAHQRIIHSIDSSSNDSTGQLETQEGGASRTRRLLYFCDGPECDYKTLYTGDLKRH